MITNHYDVAVVGAGPVGSAAARHLAERGIDVAVVGPEEPLSFEDHEGTWAGHYDEGRLCHVLEVPLMTSILTVRSVRRFDDLRARTGIEFTTPTHSVTVLPENLGDGSASTWFDRDLLASNARDLGVRVHELDEDGLKTNYPNLSFEPGHVALVQPDAFILNPRALVRAEMAAAKQAGAHLIRDEIAATEKVDGGVRLTGRSGRTWAADQVVLATGAASNMTGLLPRPLAMTSFSATVVLAEVEDPEALSMPTMMYLKYRDGERLYGGIVMAPPPVPRREVVPQACRLQPAGCPSRDRRANCGMGALRRQRRRHRGGGRRSARPVPRPGVHEVSHPAVPRLRDTERPSLH